MQNSVSIYLEFEQKMKLMVFASLAVIVLGQHLNTHELQQLVDAGFVSLDVNPKDNLLEYDELVTLFNQKDVDGDGLLSMTEFQAHVGADFLFAEPLFNNYDVNKDQKLSVQEFVDNAYHAMNTNGDTQVTRHEFDHYYTQLLHHLNQHHG
uniref:EF-hand domain-containing protein n=2 Tax=Magallana gigas TaxID=29159 RepID=A0A8W8L537_MAGGI